MNDRFYGVAFTRDIIDRFTEDTALVDLWSDLETLKEARYEIHNKKDEVVEYIEKSIAEKTAEMVEKGYCPECGAELESEEIYPETRIDVGVYRAVCPNCDWKED